MNESLTLAVTGAAGYIGSRVVYELQRAHPDWDFIALDNFYRGDIREIGKVDIQHVDIRDRARLEQALEGSDIVMHLAAISGVDDCDENQDLAYEVNVQGTENVAWYCRKTGAGLIFPFSMAVIGDPEAFPITVDHPRDPLNWYGRTKLMSELAIDSLANDAFPAHLFLKSNLYGDHFIHNKRVTKGTVINFFVDRALNKETLTVYEPGSQARNYIHVKDVAQAYLESAEHLLTQLEAEDTGVWEYEIASEEDPSVETVAKRVADITEEERGYRPDIDLVENPRGNETLVSDFEVDTTKAREQLGWEPTHSVDDSIRSLIQARTA